MSIKRQLALVVALWVLSDTAQAYQPNGWAWYEWPYAYEHESGEWYWFNTADRQWVLGPIPNGGWSMLSASPLASGWTYTAWPYAYDWESHTWFYLNEINTQWCVGLTSLQWSRFGNAGSSASTTLIPAGAFMAGNALSVTGDGYSDEVPVNRVDLNAFYIDRYEVTKALWDEVRTWGLTNGYTDLPVGGGKASTHPVYSITWHAAVKWCNARSQKESRSPCYTVNGNVYKTGLSAPDCNWSTAGYRLPTAAEWEKAARGGVSGKRFPWSGSDHLQHAQANYNSTNAYRYDTSTTGGYHPNYAVGTEPFTSPVGSFAANGYGLYDMAGNLWEWCWDWSGADGYGTSPVTDPHGPSSGTNRVFRGGSWDLYADDCRVASRHGDLPERAGDDVGFRCVVPIPR